MTYSEIVRAVVPREGVYDLAMSVSAAKAATAGWKVLDEPTHTPDGRLRRPTRVNGRKAKPQTSVAEAAEKKAAESADKPDTIEPSEKE